MHYNLSTIPMRILGINIPDNKKIEYSLPYIYGLGLALTRKILKQVQVDPHKRARDLTPAEINRIREVVERSYKIEGDLRRDIMTNIKRLRELQ